jgi:isoquinoline 1-oxidoreductase subunit beta
MKKTINTRRDFLKTTALTSFGFALGISSSTAAELTKIQPAFLSLEINPFIIIDNEGGITLVNTRPDMGQGSTQAVPSLLAEELEVTLQQVRIIQSDGQEKYGSQLSGGSSSVRGLWMPLRRAGAAAREMLLETAAKRWGVPVTECYASEGKIYLKESNKSFGYGELAEDASKLEIPQNPTLKDPKDFKIIGKYNKRLDVPQRVTGKAVFGIDVEVPNMLYACIAHSPTIHAKVKNYDAADTLVLSGVRRVLKCLRPMPHTKSEAVAVIANDYWTAKKGVEMLKIDWNDANLKTTQTTENYFKESYKATEKEGINHEEKGDFDAYTASQAKKVSAIYETPFLAHAALEPVNAIAHVKNSGEPNESVEIWAPVQGPDGAIREIADYLKISPEHVKVNVTLLGGAFGRKAYLDFVLEAVHLSKEVGQPIKLIWTREDDMSQGPFRPAMLSQLEGGIGTKNELLSLHHHAIGESILGQIWNGLPPYQADPWLAGELSQENHQYNFASHKLSYSRVKTEIPIVWWRSVYASNFAWGQECFIDEMALAANTDPLDARMELLKNAPRFQKVLQLLAEKTNWKQPLGKDKGKGIAIFRSFDSISAACVFVSKNEEGGVKIDKVVSVIDCGYYVNPDNVKAQTEGNIVMGLTAAIKDGITFTAGKCDQTNFHQYNVLRINETPIMEIHIVESGEKPGGVGEPGLPPIAPALGNAIFNLTGKRLRKLPISLSEIV